VLTSWWLNQGFSACSGYPTREFDLPTCRTLPSAHNNSREEIAEQAS